MPSPVPFYGFRRSMVGLAAGLMLLLLVTAALLTLGPASLSGWLPGVQAAPPSTSAPVQTVSPLQLVKTPDQFLNKQVTFDGEFSGFTGLGLDYSKAMRSSKDYVGVLVRRPDVRHHHIPLAELKLFYPRTKSESLTTLEPGDMIRVRGKVFSTALQEPWLDIDQLTVVKKKPKAAE